MTIWKFSVPIEEVQDIVHFQMPRGAHVLSTHRQGQKVAGGRDEGYHVDTRESLVVFAKVDPMQSQVSRRFRLVGTGHDLKLPVNARFVGTAIFMEGQFVLHVYDLGEVS